MAGREPTRVWATRDEPADGPLCGALRRAGLEPVCLPVVRRRVVADLSADVRSLGPDDWLVLASPYAIEALGWIEIGARVAVVGESSRHAAEHAGMRVALTSPDGTGAALWDAVAASIGRARRVLYPRSSLSSPPGTVGGVVVESPVLYRTEPIKVEPAAVRGLTIAALASPSAAREVVRIAPSVRGASIGPTTSAALRGAGIEPWVEAPTSSFDALAGAIAGAVHAGPRSAD